MSDKLLSSITRISELELELDNCQSDKKTGQHIQADLHKEILNLRQKVREVKLRDVSLNRKDQNCDLSVLRFKGNSCWLDSVWFILLALPDPFVTKYILNAKVKNENVNDVQKELNAIVAHIRKIEISPPKTCLSRIWNSPSRPVHNENTTSKLRELWTRTNQPGFINTNMNSTSQQHSANEYLLLIFQLFEVPNLLTTSFTTYTRYGKDWSQSEAKDENISVIVSIPNSEVKAAGNKPTIQSLLKYQGELADTGKLQHRAITKIEGGFMIITIDRFDGDQNVAISEYIEVSETKLYLFGIIVHTLKNINEGHYTGYLKCNENWLYYDDLASELVLVGDFDRMLDYKPSVQNKGVTFFYSANDRSLP
jgi:hypothetical protein